MKARREISVGCFLLGLLFALGSWYETSSTAQYSSQSTPDKIQNKIQDKKIRLKDSEINQAVFRELQQEFASQIDPLKTHTQQGLVTIDGRTDNLRVSRRAIDLALEVRGVKSVVSRIHVDPPKRRNLDLKRDALNVISKDPKGSILSKRNIQVEAQDGVVILKGDVASWGEKKIAADEVEVVPGVKDIRNLIQVNFKKTPSRKEILEDIQNRLSMNPWVYLDPIQVEVAGNSVILRGRVRSAASKKSAYESAWVAGIQRVNVDQIQVDPGLSIEDKMMIEGIRPGFRMDKEIKNAIQNSFFYDSRLSFFNPHVLVDQGVVTLKGKVASLDSKNAAENHSWGIVGVRSVNNQVEVDPGGAVAATEIATKSREKLRMMLPSDVYPNVSIANTGVTGELILTGKAQSRFEKKEIEEGLSQIPGVVTLINRVEVDAPDSLPPHEISPQFKSQSPDDQLKDRVITKLYWNPLIDWVHDDVNVQVVKGVVQFSGFVDDWVEHLVVTQEAFAAGAKQVENSLKVGGQVGQPVRTYSYMQSPYFG
jgi:osmotically-inducible protein OsmY